jgi:crossover junction endodeoxyribonuclease RusA
MRSGDPTEASCTSRRHTRIGSRPLAGRLAIEAVRPDKRRRDIDNLIKPVSDLLCSIGVIEDDSYCEKVSAEWITGGEGILTRIESIS